MASIAAHYAIGPDSFAPDLMAEPEFADEVFLELAAGMRRDKASQKRTELRDQLDRSMGRK